MPRCSVIIPVFNRASLTRQCLNALLDGRSGLDDVEIVVVDDASTDITPALLASYGGRIRVVRHPVNAGFGTSCNDGAAAASGEHLVFLNNDTIPTRGWLKALAEYADRHPAAAVVGAKLLFPNHTIQHAGVVICQDRLPRHIYSCFPADHPAVNKSRRFQVVTAGCALFRRAPFEAAGGFDLAFRNGYEDVDLCLRLGERGHEVHYCHEAVLYHLESATRDGRHAEERANSQLYEARWARRVQPDDVQYYLEDGLLTLSYGDAFPLQLSVSPLLGLLENEERARQADRLLQARSRQVFELLKENMRLGARWEEARLDFPTEERRPAQPPRPRLPVSRSEPRLLVEGHVRWLSNEPPERLISIIIPVKNGAAQLRELLPRIFRQQGRDSVEVVAVDSGSTDDSVEVLREALATVVSVEPAAFNHGLTRNLAASYAQGQVLVFVNQSALPADDRWLASLVAPLQRDPTLAGVCSRVVPCHDADLLTLKDGRRDPSGSAERSARAIVDWAAYRALTHHQLRLLVNFHTVSAAIRPEILQRIPFREVTIGEDVLWAKEVLEAGLKIQHEPDSVVLHSHNYSYAEILRRNVDDGLANHQIVGRQIADDEIVPMILALVRDDWRYLELECGLAPDDLERWRIASVLRRTAQMIGQWIGVNYDRLGPDLGSLLSMTERAKAGASDPARLR